MMNKHVPVLLKETIDYLNIKPNGIYVDCTFGRGGHSKAILDKLSKDGLLICVDKDPEAINYGSILFKNDSRVILVKDDYCNLDQILKKLKIANVDGIIADLGISSPQIDNPERGFSYRYDAFLDMRMDLDQKLTAYDVINNYPDQKLIDIFYRYGDIKNSKKFVSLIIKNRKIKNINTTFEFLNIIKQFVPLKTQFNNKSFPNTFFQALRIEVNKEFYSLKKFFSFLSFICKSGCRICLITFHSLEDKLVVSYFKNLSFLNLPIEVPINNIKTPFTLLTKKPVLPGLNELTCNPRSKSAKLRVMEKN